MIVFICWVAACFFVGWLLFLVYKMIAPMWGGGDNQARISDPSSWRLECRTHEDGHISYHCVKSDSFGESIYVCENSEEEAVQLFTAMVNDAISINKRWNVVKTEVVK